MKGKIFYGALAVLSLAACSQEEVLDVNRSGDEIAFSVVTNKATRAAALYDNNTDPGDFRVWGNLETNGTSYFAEDLVTKQIDGSWKSSNTRYWPDKTLNFFAIAGCDADLTITGGSSASFAYTVLGETGNNGNKSVANQEDVIYAAALSRTKEQGKVPLNFAHALSQIVFKAKNSNQKLYVVVSGVKVAHLKNSGTFTFTQSTDTEWNEAETGSYTANNNRATGNWNSSTLIGDATYEITCTTDVPLTSTAADLESTETDKKKDAMLLMPQSQNAWNAPENGTPSGFYFGLKCRIYNIANSSYENTDVQLWGAKTKDEDGKEKFTGEEAYVYIPATINWQAGKKYIYTFNFGNGNGGFEPDPNTDEPDPNKPVLIPIEYTVTVDDFDIVEDKTVLVNGENNTTVTQ